MSDGIGNVSPDLCVPGFLPDFWFHLGISLTKEERYSDAIVCFLMSAFTEYSEMDSWCNALSCSFQEKDSNFSAVIIKCAFDKFGEEFIVYFSETRQLNENSDPIEAQLVLVELMQLLNESKSKVPFEIRLHGRDGGYDKILMDI